MLSVLVAHDCNPAIGGQVHEDGMGRMASLTLQKLQICVRTKAIFKLGNKGEGLIEIAIALRGLWTS